MAPGDGRKPDKPNHFDNRKRKASVMDPPPLGPAAQAQRYPPSELKLDLNSMLGGETLTLRTYNKIQAFINRLNTDYKNSARASSTNGQELSHRTREIEDCRKHNVNLKEQVEALLKEIEHLTAENTRVAEGGESSRVTTYLRLQLRTQGETVDDRAREIVDFKKQNSLLKGQVESATKEIQRLKAEKEFLTGEGEGSVKTLEEQVKQKDDLLALGTKVMKDKTESTKRVEDENSRLRTTISERDNTIGKLNDQLFKVAAGPVEEQVKARLDMQAQQTLSLVEGLKSDVQARDGKIQAMQGQIQRQHGAIVTHNRTQESLKRELEAAKREVASKKDLVEATTKKAKQAEDVATEQGALIMRIMAENERLGKLR